MQQGLQFQPPLSVIVNLTPPNTNMDELTLSTPPSNCTLTWHAHPGGAAPVPMKCKALPCQLSQSSFDQITVLLQGTEKAEHLFVPGEQGCACSAPSPVSVFVHPATVARSASVRVQAARPRSASLVSAPPAADAGLPSCIGLDVHKG